MWLLRRCTPRNDNDVGCWIEKIVNMKKGVLIWVLCLFYSIGMAQERQVIRAKSSMKFIQAGQERIAKTVKEIPDLVIKDEVFSDPNENNMINANEASEIRFNIENLGEGTARNVKVRISLKNYSIQGLSYTKVISIGPVFSSEVKEVTIPVSGSMELTDAIAEFKIEVQEESGFDAYPLEMKIETHSFEPPKVIIADGVFSTPDGGKLRLNQFLTLKFIIQNTGKSIARDVRVTCILPNDSCVLTGETDRFLLGDLISGDNKEINLEFVATRRYKQHKIPIRIVVDERHGKYGQDTTLSVSLNQNLLAQKNVTITPILSPDSPIEIASLTSNVDRDIPFNPTVNQNRYALVIGNEDYHKYQKGISSEMNVAYARNDATVFKEYLVKTLGFPERNVYFLLDATAGEMNQKLDLISKLVAKAGDNAELVFFYAGHGLPHEVTHIPYLIPVDVSGTNLGPAIKLSEVYQKLGESGASRVTIFLDACFSGGGRSSGLLAARSVRIKPSTGDLSGNTIVFTATSGEQSALPYAKEKHGMFSYYLLKKLQDTGGDITYGELADYLIKTVSSESLHVNEKEQDPEVRVSLDVKNEWREFGMRSEE